MRFEAIECSSCGAKLTQEEIDWFWDSERCCDGYTCGCMGLPIYPPCCFKCMGNKKEV